MTHCNDPKLWWGIVAIAVVLIFFTRIVNEASSHRDFTPAPEQAIYSNVSCYTQGFDLICPGQANQLSGGYKTPRPYGSP